MFLTPIVRKFTYAVISMGMLIACPLTHAQDSDGQLTAMRTSFLRQLEATSKPINDKFVNALQAIERKAIAVRDYEAALAAWNRAQEVLDRTGFGPGTIALYPRDADLEDVSLDEEIDVLNGWQADDSVASWALPSIVPGIYEVILQYSAAPLEEAGPTGSVTVELENLTSPLENEISTKITPTFGWKFYKSVSIGKLEALGTSSTFSITCDNRRGFDLMRLKSVHLVLVSTSPDSGSQSKLDNLRNLHYERLALLRKPLVESYQTNLDLFLSKVPPEEHSHLSNLISREKVRSTRLITEIERLTNHAEPAESDETPEQPPLIGARWVPDTKNTGDSFQVTHGGKNFRIKLHCVTAPTVVAEDEDSASYFGITKAQAGRVGVEAQKFAANFLEGRELTLFPVGEAPADGSVPEMIVAVNGVGIFDRILVYRGLARINRDIGNIRISKGNMATHYARDILRPAETEARNNKRGAWSLTK